MEKYDRADETISRLYRHIIEADRSEANRLLAGVVGHIGYNDTLRIILEPTLRLVGERWAADSISLAQGFVAGKVAEDYLVLGKNGGAIMRNTILRNDDEAAPASDGSALPARIAVLGNVEDDYHVLGRSMVASFLGIEDWNVIDLGCDIIASDFIDQAVASGACVIGASAMMLTTAKNIIDIRRKLDERGLSGSIKLAVGGAVFTMRPDLVAEVGGDGTARTAMEAPALFERLRRLVTRT